MGAAAPFERYVHLRDAFMRIERVESNTTIWEQLIHYAEQCSWSAGRHVASLMRDNRLVEWESIFVALKDSEIVGFCTFLKTDYYPNNKYSPWISSVFVDEKHRGNRVSQRMIDTVVEYAKTNNFSKVYIPSSIVGLYEKYGFYKVDELSNYDGDSDSIFVREIG